LVWTIEYDRKVEAKFKRLDKATAQRLVDFLEKRVALRADPRSIGEALLGATLGDYWKYRIGDYRIIVDIQDSRLTILALEVDHRSKVYKKH